MHEISLGLNQALHDVVVHPNHVFEQQVHIQGRILLTIPILLGEKSLIFLAHTEQSLIKSHDSDDLRWLNLFGRRGDSIVVL